MNLKLTKRPFAKFSNVWGDAYTRSYIYMNFFLKRFSIMKSIFMVNQSMQMIVFGIIFHIGL